MTGLSHREERIRNRQLRTLPEKAGQKEREPVPAPSWYRHHGGFFFRNFLRPAGDSRLCSLARARLAGTARVGEPGSLRLERPHRPLYHPLKQLDG